MPTESMNETPATSTLIILGRSFASTPFTTSRMSWALSLSISPVGWMCTVPPPSVRAVIDSVDIVPPGQPRYGSRKLDRATLGDESLRSNVEPVLSTTNSRAQPLTELAEGDYLLAVRN